MSFDGIPEQAIVFYEGLVADNSRPYWNDHRAVYDLSVRAPMLALIAGLEPEFGPAKLFRPYRNVRFSKDKTPYKDHAAFVSYSDSGAARYCQLGADGIHVGGGYWHASNDQGLRLRAAIEEDRSGRALVPVLDALVEAGWELHGDRYVRLPKPFSPEHPRADLLRSKSLAVMQQLEPAEWMHTPQCLDRIAALWRELGPLNDWLGRHVGPPRDVGHR